MRQSQRERKRGKRKRTGLQPIQNKRPRIKRNALCPCGSGKKTKYCCLKQVKLLESIPPEQRLALLTDVLLSPTKKPIAQLQPVSNVAAEAMLPNTDLHTNVEAAIEKMKGKANENT